MQKYICYVNKDTYEIVYVDQKYSKIRLRMNCALKNLAMKLVVLNFWCCVYSKTCLKWPLKNRQNKGLKDKWYLDEGRKYCRMLSWSILQYL